MRVRIVWMHFDFVTREPQESFCVVENEQAVEKILQVGVWLTIDKIKRVFIPAHRIMAVMVEKK